MKDLYLAIAVLCFIVAIMMYCVNKSVQALRKLYYTWRNYKIISKEILDYLKENDK